MWQGESPRKAGEKCILAWMIGNDWQLWPCVCGKSNKPWETECYKDCTYFYLQPGSTWVCASDYASQSLSRTLPTAEVYSQVREQMFLYLDSLSPSPQDTAIAILASLHWWPGTIALGYECIASALRIK